jgi:hypothetical protein
MEAAIRGVKNSRRRTAGAEENLFFAGEHETGIARRKSSFSAESRWHVVGGERIPALAVDCLEQEEFAVYGIAERQALFFGKAGDGVEKKLPPSVRVL